MAVWCFVCDALVEGDVCPRCGRPGTLVEDAPRLPDERSGPIDRLRRMPRWVWVLAGLLLTVILFALLRSGFHLE